MASQWTCDHCTHINELRPYRYNCQACDHYQNVQMPPEILGPSGNNSDRASDHVAYQLDYVKPTVAESIQYYTEQLVEGDIHDDVISIVIEYLILKLHEGDVLDIRDRHGVWCVARIEEMAKDGAALKIHFVGWSHLWDNWINVSSGRIAPWKSFTDETENDSRIYEEVEPRLLNRLIGRGFPRFASQNCLGAMRNDIQRATNRLINKYELWNVL